MMPGVDTVEWGGSDRAAKGSWLARFDGSRFGRATLGRWGAVVLAAGGFGLLIAAEVLPWTQIKIDPDLTQDLGTGILDHSQLSFGLNRLQTVDTLTYHLGWIAVLVLVGAVLSAVLAAPSGSVSPAASTPPGEPASPPDQASSLTQAAHPGGVAPLATDQPAGEPHQEKPFSRVRRGVLGAAVGAIAAEIILVIAVIRSFDLLLFGNGRMTSDLPTGVSTSVQSGAFCAFAALALLLAAVVLAVLPAGPVQRRTRQAATPATAAGPTDLTVSAAPPYDEHYFTRPD